MLIFHMYTFVSNTEHNIENDDKKRGSVKFEDALSNASHDLLSRISEIGLRGRN